MPETPPAEFHDRLADTHLTDQVYMANTATAAMVAQSLILTA